MKQVTQWMQTVIFTIFGIYVLTACTKDGDVIYVTDPADQANSAPLVTVVYSANALGDGNYNDLIYQGVERAALDHGLRTMQLSPATHEEGLAYLETLFQQLSNQQDTVRRLLIVASAGYDDYLRQNNKRLESNPYCDLLYMETITEAVDGFTTGYYTDYMTVSESEAESKELTIKYLSDDVYGGFTVSDDIVVDIMKAPIKQSFYNLVVPICGGAATTFQRI